MKPLATRGYTNLNSGTCPSITNTGIQHDISTELYASCKLITGWSCTSTSPVFLYDLCRENFVFFCHFITRFFPLLYSLSMLSMGAIISKIESVVK
jgi:hypothetical protein